MAHKEPAQPDTLSAASTSGGVSREAQSGRLGFTMAEILLSLTIIGVVAAITLPSLTGNINERTWNTQRKALYARMSQAISLMPSLNGYGTLIEGDSSTSAVDTAAETFVTSGLSKVLKINNICDSEHLADCGIPTSLSPLNGGEKFSTPIDLYALNEHFSNIVNTKAAAFETQNGESIIVYYNPNCQTENAQISSYQSYHYANGKMCANFIYDLNGNKGPNTVGKDIGFITTLYAIDSTVVAPMPLMTDADTAVWDRAAHKCKTQDSESRTPNYGELASMFYNKKLIGNFTSHYYWSGTLISDNGTKKAWALNNETGELYTWGLSPAYTVRCIKR